MSLTPVPIGSPSSTRHHRHLPARCPSVGAQRRMWGDFVVGAASDAVCNASDLAGIAGSSRSPSEVADTNDACPDLVGNLSPQLFANVEAEVADASSQSAYASYAWSPHVPMRT